MLVKKMGNEADLWDDSALIHAFDNALSNYKLMHNQGLVIQADNNISTLITQTCEPRNSEKDGSDDAASKIEAGVVSLPDNGHHQLESGDPNITASSMNGQNVQSNQTGIADTQSLEDYNQLLIRYNELEDQRQKVLQQLSQFGYWDYENYNASGGDHHTMPPAMTASQEHQAYATPGSCSNVECTCCPYWCQILSASCTSLSNGGLGAVSVDNVGNPISIVEGKTNGLETKLNLSTETDLNAVTNAWYTAGFHTGKYLAEQKRQL